MLEGLEIGYDDSSSASEAQHRGMVLALDVLAFSGNIWPDHNPELKKMIAGVFLDKVQAFAITARRYMDIKQIHDFQVEDRRWHLPAGHEPEGHLPSYSLRKVLGKIIHARELKTIIFPTGEHKIYPNHGDAVITHITIQSDHGAKVRVCPFGMATAFCTEIMHNR
ncbi:MAG: hypothetical protein NZ734_14650 [Paracoccus sp.]|nr:hypothetical protein [Paracoccus sp. (in: a-proteobacteria)]